MIFTRFETPGLIDLNAFKTFGCNSKPNSTNPIGYFGTGLKYAMAVLAREGVPTYILRGKDIYSITAESLQFRDKQFKEVHMTRFKKGLFACLNHSNALPYTTELGKNWKLWQVFRELYANTIDEDGDVGIVGLPLGSFDIGEFAKPNTTVILVEGFTFMDEFHNRFNIFLPEAATSRSDAATVQIIDRPSKHVYYRGMRVMDLEHESVLTYNILTTIELTEDRTAKDPMTALNTIRDNIVQYATHSQVETILRASEDTLEGRLNWQYCWHTPSEQFKEAATRIRPSYSGLHSYLRTHTPKVTKSIPLCTPDELIEWLEERSPREGTSIANAIEHCLIPAIRNGDVSFSVYEDFPILIPGEA